jgi:hypothetical protein
MGILQDVFNALQAFEITKIDGQPTDDNINKLTTHLTAALVTISTTNGGGKLGHIGIVVPESRYVVLSKGSKLDRPVNPGAYPATADDDKKIREQQVADDVLRKSTGNGGQSRYLQSTTSSTRSKIIPEAFMNGRPMMVLTETFGPVTTISNAVSPSFVR